MANKNEETKEEILDFKKEKELANDLLEKGENDGALFHYKKALELNPEYAEGYCNTGIILFGKGELEEAEKNFQISLMKDENLIESYFNLASLYQDRADFEKALSFYKEIVLRQPEDATVYLRMGICAQSVGRSDDAQAFFEEAFRLQPNSLEIGAALSGLYVEKEQHHKAEDVLQVSLVSYPENVSLHFSLGLILKAQKKYESALAQFNKVVALDKGHAGGFYHLAECCVELDLLEQAEPFFAKAFKLDQTMSEPVLQLGKLFEKMKKVDKAVIMYRQWVEMVDHQTWNFKEEMQESFKKICMFIADYYVDKGDDKEASFYRDKAESLGEEELGIKNVLVESGKKDYRVSLQIDD